MSASFVTKLTRNVLHQHIGNGNKAIILMHGLGGTFGEYHHVGLSLNKRLNNSKKIISVSLPLHNNAPSLHGDNNDIEWGSSDVEHSLSVLCDEYSINKCILVSTAFTGYPSIAFRLNNPTLVAGIVSVDWIIKAPDKLLMNHPKTLYKNNDKDEKLIKFKNERIKGFTNNGTAPLNVIKYINEAVVSYPLSVFYRSLEYAHNCYKIYGQPYEAFKFLFDTELENKEIENVCNVLFLSRQQNEEQEAIISQLKRDYDSYFHTKIMGETVYSPVEKPDAVTDSVIQFTERLKF